MLRKDPIFPPLTNLSQEVTVLPLFWAQEGYDQLPTDCWQKLNLALILPELFSDGLIISCLVIGLFLVICPLFQGAKSLWIEQQLYKYSLGGNLSPENHIRDKSYNPLPFEDDSRL